MTNVKNMKYKYPKTTHLPFSLGLQNDDRRISNADYEAFKTFNVIGTEKMDGESFTVYRDCTHARSLDSGDHPSRSYSKMYAATFQHLIPEGWRFVFENCYAEHSISYYDLPVYCFLLNIWNDSNVCLSWKETGNIASDLGLTLPKTYFEGKYDEDAIKKIYSSLDTDRVEGLVFRNTEPFHYSDFSKNVAKLVRKGHVQTDQHWMSKPVTSNKLLT